MKPDLRKEMWQGDLKRCFFCTPQTFWNDVRRGGCVGHGGVTALLVAASQGCLLPGRCPRGRGPLALYIHATVWADNAAAASISRTCAVACRHLPLRQGGVPCCGRVPPRHRCARRPLCAMPEPNAWVDLWWRTCLSHGCAASLAPPSVPACRASGTPASRRPVSTNPLTACALQASTMSCTRYSTCGSTSAGFGCWGCRPRRVLMAPRFRCEEGSQGVQTGLCLERSAPGAGCGLCA